MEYKLKMQGVVELPSYLKEAEKLFTEAEREAIAWMVASDPECGEVIPGTGGFRTVRVGRAGMGKRGGARVIYILRNENYPIFLTDAFAKNQKENLTRKELNELARFASVLFATYGSRR